MESPAEFGAVVSGTEIYTTALQWADGVLALLCNCPYFLVEGKNCKHLWATILTADEQGFLNEATDMESVALDTKSLADELSGDGADVEHARAARALRAVFPATPPPKPALWKRQLDRIAEATVAPSTGMSPWPRNAEVLYLLDVAKSQQKQAIVLTIASREPRKQGGWKYSTKPCAVSRSRIPSLPTEADREILSMLIGAGPYSPYSYGYSDPYDRGAEASPFLLRWRKRSCRWCFGPSGAYCLLSGTRRKRSRCVGTKTAHGG